MIVEQAVFAVKDAKAFEAAFAEARKLIQASSGFQRLEMRRGIEAPDTFLLLVWWDSVEAHMKGFRDSEGFKQWRALLGPHFASPPQVQHFGESL